MITITIDRAAGDAVYVQIAYQVRQLMASGGLVPGTPLPSVRQLARDLGVSLNTVARAYRLLEAEGFLLIRDRAGVTVAPPAPGIDDATRVALVEELQVILAKLRQAGMDSDELLRLVRAQADDARDENGGAGE